MPSASVIDKDELIDFSSTSVPPESTDLSTKRTSMTIMDTSIEYSIPVQLHPTPTHMSSDMNMLGAKANPLHLQNSPSDNTDNVSTSSEETSYQLFLVSRDSVRRTSVDQSDHQKEVPRDALCQQDAPQPNQSTEYRVVLSMHTDTSSSCSSQCKYYIDTSL